MESSYLTFSLNKMPNGEVHGAYVGGLWRGGKFIGWLSSPYGMLATEAFPKAVELAQEHGIPHISVNDPEMFSKLGLGKLRQTETPIS